MEWWSEMSKINGVVEQNEQKKWSGGAKCAKMNGVVEQNVQNKWCGGAK